MSTPPSSTFSSLSNAAFRIGGIGDRAEDDEETKLQHRFLVWMGLLMSVGGLVWGALTTAAGLGLTSVVPFGYVSITAVNLAIFASTKNFARARTVQVTVSLLLPFLFQLVLGGFAASGAVMLWAMLALLGSLTFSSARESLRWLAMFLLCTIVSGVTDGWARQTFQWQAGDDLRALMFVVSISGIVSTVFGLTIYLLASRRADNVALREANAHVSSLVGVLEAQVRRAEKAEKAALEANVAKSRFLANMSHELRTPLNAILGYTELLMEDSTAIGADLRRVQDAGQMLLQMINDVLDLSKVEAGQMGVDRLAVDLADVVRQVVAMVEPLASKNGTVVRTEVDPALVPVMTDPLKVRKILYNLLGNAAKFTRGGAIVARVKGRPGTFSLEVEDSGIGMTAQQLARVRRPFVQADDSTTRRFGGSGLGLHLVDRYAVMLGGRLELESAPGVGTKATVTLPATAASEEELSRSSP